MYTVYYIFQYISTFTNHNSKLMQYQGLEIKRQLSQSLVDKVDIAHMRSMLVATL